MTGSGADVEISGVVSRDTFRTAFGRIRGVSGRAHQEVSEVDLGGHEEGPDPSHPEGQGFRGEAREAACEGDSEAGDSLDGRDPRGPRSAPTAAARGPGSLRGRGRPRGLGSPEVEPRAP